MVTNTETKIQQRINNNNVIDLKELLFELQHRWLLILAAVLAGAIIAGTYTKLFITPIYSATSTMLVLTKETTLASVADLQIGTQLTNDYSRLITSRSVLQEVVDNLDLDMNYKVLKANVAVNNPSDTRLLEITVTNPNPEMAKKITDELASVSSDYIGEQMEVVPPKIIEKGEEPKGKTSPSMSRNIVVGALLGFIAVAGVVTLKVVLDDTLKTEEDIERYLGITALTSIPDRKDYLNLQKNKGKKSSDRRKKRRSK